MAGAPRDTFNRDLRRPQSLSPALEAARAARADKALQRRKHVATLLAWGYSASEIADRLETPLRTIHDDCHALDAEMALSEVPLLQTRINRAIAVRREVQKAAWRVHNDERLDAKAQNKVAALSAVLAAQDAIDRLEGTSAPDAVNSRVVAELYNTMMDVLGAAGGPVIQARVMAELAARVGGTTAGMVVSGSAQALPAPDDDEDDEDDGEADDSEDDNDGGDGDEE